MRKLSIRVFGNLNISYNHYLSTELINRQSTLFNFKRWYPLGYPSRVFDKPAVKWRDSTCIWLLDDKEHRVGKPAWIWANGDVEYWENGERVQ